MSSEQIKRYDLDLSGCDADRCGADVNEYHDGLYILYTDHLAELSRQSEPITPDWIKQAVEDGRMGTLTGMAVAHGLAEKDRVIARQSEGLDREVCRWQDAIGDVCQQLAPGADIDGSGCDSGDPLDVTLSEITQAVNWHVDALHDQSEELAEAKELLGRALPIIKHHNSRGGKRPPTPLISEIEQALTPPTPEKP